MSVSIGALAITSKQQKKLLEVGWGKLDDSTKSKIQAKKDCCGFSSEYMTNSTVDGKMFHPSCEQVTAVCTLGRNPSSLHVYLGSTNQGPGLYHNNSCLLHHFAPVAELQWRLATNRHCFTVLAPRTWKKLVNLESTGTSGFPRFCKPVCIFYMYMYKDWAKDFWPVASRAYNQKFLRALQQM